MRPSPFDLIQPTTLADALGALRNGARPLAGGQSLLQAMRLRQAEPPQLVDLGGLPELQAGITLRDGRLRIGALTTYRSLLENPDVKQHCPWLVDAAAAIGDVQVRNLGTVGGNLCWADPRANMAVALLASDAVVTVIGRHGPEQLPLGELFTGFRQTSLDDRLLASIDVQSTKRFGVYLEFSRQRQDLALCNVCIVSDQQNNTYRVAVGGIDQAPRRLPELEAALSSGESSHIDAALSASLEPECCSDLGESFAPFSYRLELARTLLERVIAEFR